MPSPARSNWLFLLCLVTLSLVSPPLHQLWGLGGLVATELLIFLLLPLVFAAVTQSGNLREIFRLRALTLGGVGKAVLLGLTAWIIGQTLASLSLVVVHKLGGQMPELYTSLMSAPLWLALLAGALLPAVCEEVAFRGYVQWGFGPFGARTAIILTGVLFGAMHLSLIRLLPLSVLGILFSLAVARSGSILTGIIMHLVNNGTTLILAFATRSEPATETMGEITAGALLLWLALGIFASVAIWALLRTIQPPAAESAPAKPTRRPAWVEFAPLLPTLYLFASYARYELLRVFGGR